MANQSIRLFISRLTNAQKTEPLNSIGISLADEAGDDGTEQIGREQNRKRKEVNAMNEYTKPEVLVLGDAASLIQGSKPGRGDSVNPLAQIAADECTED